MAVYSDYGIAHREPCVQHRGHGGEVSALQKMFSILSGYWRCVFRGAVLGWFSD
jgi:hypothetical protein